MLTFYFNEKETEERRRTNTIYQVVEIVVVMGARVGLVQGPGGRGKWGVTNPVTIQGNKLNRS